MPVDVRVRGLVDLPTAAGALVVQQLLQSDGARLLLVVPLDLAAHDRVTGEVAFGVEVVLPFLRLPAQESLTGDPVGAGYFSLAPEPW